MNYLIFLPKDDQIKLRIIEEIAHGDGQGLSIKSLIHDLNISKYKLSRSLDDIISVIADISETASIEIDNGDIQVANIDYVFYRQAQLYFVKHSLLFQVFVFEYIDDGGQTRQEFIDERFISQAKFYNLRSIIDGEMKKANAITNSLRLNMHNEFMRRIQIVKIYYYYFNGVEDPFPELKDMTAKFMNVITMTYKLSLSPSEKDKLRIFFQVQAKRLLFHNFVNIRDIVKIIDSDATDVIRKFYDNHIETFNESDEDSEVAYLVSFLISQEQVSETEVDFSSAIASKFDVLIRKFTEIITEAKVIDHNVVSGEVAQKIATSLGTLNHKILIFDFQLDIEAGVDDHETMTRDYPGLQKIADKMAKTIISVFDINGAEDDFDSIQDNYLFELIDALPDNALLDKIQICVDFSGNHSTRNFIVDSLQRYFNKNIVISAKYSRKSDIYVSDMFEKNITGIKQVTLPTLFDTGNLKKLSNTICDVRQAKLNAI